MIGNINKGDRRRKETVIFLFILFFLFFLPRATGTQSWDPVVAFVGIHSVRSLPTPILHLGQRDASSAGDESTQKRTKVTHVTATLRGPSFVSISLDCVVCAHRNSLRCLFVLRFGEPEETRGATNAAHYFETASQRVPTQFSRFQITSRRLFPFALKFTTLRQRSPVSSS